ncbi:hypothetical protein LZP73_06040 [Shewanella sp. AS16]|uniref:hypothetical protein n=1 Tax=Shewanella sp. AS16 TaxID=2907625 RepID=UPI001F32D433|nr:hypothetical protein [Shewanella sp. AS16]MCE9685777.1 hypothetical protein [Shewanella sp. AS16]
MAIPPARPGRRRPRRRTGSLPSPNIGTGTGTGKNAATNSPSITPTDKPDF